MIKTLMKEIKEYKRDSILAPIFVMLEVFLELIIPLMMAAIIDNGLEMGDIRYVVYMGIVMIVTAMFALWFGILSGKYAARASTGFAANLRESMYKNIQTFSFSNIDKYSTSGLITRLTTDITYMQMAYQMIIRMCVRAPFMLICAMVMSFSIHARISLIFVGAMIILSIFLAMIVRRAHPAFKEVFKKYDDLNSSVQENVGAIRVVKAYVREEHEINKFNSAADKLYGLFIKAEKLVVLNMPIMQFAMYACILLISWFGAQMIVAGSLSTGELMSLFTYVANILMSLMMISMIFVMVIMSRASAERITEILNEESDLKNKEESINIVKDGSVEFKNVTFEYKDDAESHVLTDINIKINSGETIGVIGGTGSGKSSLLQLIPRLYDVGGGEVLVGGINVRDYEIETLRNEVAMVLQKNTLFSGTIKENLRWGNKNASDEEMIRVCKLAQAHDFIETLPEKYDSHVEQGGTNFSGGQKQRLTIARALLKKPKILILDDSTSAVDTKTDSLIRKAFKEEIPNTTKIIVAQRIASVQDADKILVMHDGKINGFGNHNELIKSNKIYKEVYESQQKGADASEE